MKMQSITLTIIQLPGTNKVLLIKWCFKDMKGDNEEGVTYEKQRDIALKISGREGRAWVKLEMPVNGVL